MAITAQPYQSRYCETKVQIGGVIQTLLLTSLIVAMQTADAQTYTVLHRFTHAEGGFSTGPLIRDDKGNFYGTTQIGSTSSEYGTAFKLNQHGAVTVLHTFTGGKDGGWPGEGVLRDAAGNLYGTTMTGGDPTCNLLQYHHGCGVVFRLTAGGKFTVLHTFSNKSSDGAIPSSGGALLLDGGNLLGTTYMGGRYGKGTIFKISKTGWFSLVFSFGKTLDAGQPASGLLLIGGDFYGTGYGGTTGNGAVFKVDKHGKETVLHSFKGAPDGEFPNALLVSDNAGNLYGTTGGGGNNYLGTVFKVNKAGEETVLYNFSGGTDGEQPAAGLTWDAAGNLYGTTWGGGTGCDLPHCGTIFELTPTASGWSESIVYNFDGDWGGGKDDSGGQPESVLFRDKLGNFYGMTTTGGLAQCNSGQRPGCGVAYKFTP
jgi:uncharacterized repeat protein (TIGR03803 family)